MKGSIATALFLPVAAAACFSACSQSSSHPTGITDCQGTAAECGLGSSGPNTSGPTGEAGADAAADGATATACGNITQADPSCEACVDQTCCTPALTCSNTPECFALNGCLKLCAPGDQPCVTGCQNMHSVGQPAYNNYVSCLQTNCAVPCQIADAGVNCGQFVFAAAACDACVTQSCCAPAGVCSNDPDCFTLGQCLQTCMPTDTLCLSNCRTLSPAGVGIYAALGQCIGNNCAAECQ